MVIIKESLLFRLITEILMYDIIWWLGIVLKYYRCGRSKCRCGWARISCGLMLVLVKGAWEFKIQIYFYTCLIYSIIKILKHDINIFCYLYINCELLVQKQTACKPLGWPKSSFGFSIRWRLVVLNFIQNNFVRLCCDRCHISVH